MRLKSNGHWKIKANDFRPTFGTQYKKQSIIILGCSYAYGEFLTDEQTLGYKLSKATKRPVYNYALKGKGFQNALYIIQNNFLDANIKNPKYFIYVFLNDHVRRIYSNSCMSDFVGQPLYKLDKNNQLYLYKDYYPRYRQFYTFYFFNNIIYKLFIEKDIERNNKYVNAYFKAMNTEIKKRFPNTKFIVLTYGNQDLYKYDFSELINDDFIVLNTDCLSNEKLMSAKYQISNSDTHPNEQAWDVILNPLIERLSLW